MRPARPTRNEQQALTREKLLAAAEGVFSRFGYGGTSVDLIAAEAGYSKGAIYSNYPSKEALFFDLLDQRMGRDMAALERIVRLEPQQTLEAVRHWLLSMHAASDCPLLLVTELQLYSRRSPEFGAKYYALQEQQTRTLALILEKSFEASSKSTRIDPFDLARALTAMAHGFSVQRAPETREACNEAGRVIDEFLQSLTRRQVLR